MSNKIVAIIQARLSSNRLPGKVMLNLSEKPVIAQVFNQLSYSKLLNNVVLATSAEPSDNLLEDWAKANGKYFFRGSLNNVLERFYRAAKLFESDCIVRITADCPLIDPEIVDQVITEFLAGDFDYCTNTNPPTYPDGYDVEVFTLKALEKAFEEAALPSELEHVTLFIRNNPGLFKIGNITNLEDLSHIRLTLDKIEDYGVLNKIYHYLYKANSYISLEQVINYLSHNKDILNLNAHIKRNEGLKSSLLKEKEWN